VLPTSILNDLTSKDQISKVSSDYIAHIMSCVHTSAGWAYHIGEIKKNKLKATLLGISNEIADGVRGNDTQNLLDNIKERISNLKPQAINRGVVELTDALPGVVASLEKAENPGIPTGLGDLDELIGGWLGGGSHYFSRASRYGKIGAC